MTIQERKKKTLESALYDYMNTIEETEDIVIKLIDGECTKHDIISTMSKHRAKLKRLEMLIKKY